MTVPHGAIQQAPAKPSAPSEGAAGALLALIQRLNAQPVNNPALADSVFRETAYRMGNQRPDTLGAPTFLTKVLTAKDLGYTPQRGAGPTVINGASWPELNVSALQASYQSDPGLIAHESAHLLRKDKGDTHSHWPQDAAPETWPDRTWQRKVGPSFIYQPQP